MSGPTEDFPPSRVAEGLQTFKQAEPFGALVRVLVPDGGTNGAVEHVFEVALSQSGTLHIVLGSDPASQSHGLAVAHWLGAALVQADEDIHVVAEVGLSAHQYDGRERVAGTDLRNPFGGDVVEGDGVDQAEAQDEDVHMGVAQRAEMTKLLLLGNQQG